MTLGPAGPGPRAGRGRGGPGADPAGTRHRGPGTMGAGSDASSETAVHPGRAAGRHEPRRGGRAGAGRGGLRGPRGHRHRQVRSPGPAASLGPTASAARCPGHFLQSQCGWSSTSAVVSAVRLGAACSRDERLGRTAICQRRRARSGPAQLCIGCDRGSAWLNVSRHARWIVDGGHVARHVLLDASCNTGCFSDHSRLNKAPKSLLTRLLRCLPL